MTVSIINDLFEMTCKLTLIISLDITSNALEMYQSRFLAVFSKIKLSDHHLISHADMSIRMSVMTVILNMILI